VQIDEGVLVAVSWQVGPGGSKMAGTLVRKAVNLASAGTGSEAPRCGLCIIAFSGWLLRLVTFMLRVGVARVCPKRQSWVWSVIQVAQL
jgi:hypothetical protein